MADIFDSLGGGSGGGAATEVPRADIFDRISTPTDIFDRIEPPHAAGVSAPSNPVTPATISAPPSAAGPRVADMLADNRGIMQRLSDAKAAGDATLPQSLGQVFKEGLLNGINPLHGLRPAAEGLKQLRDRPAPSLADVYAVALKNPTDENMDAAARAVVDRVQRSTPVVNNGPLSKLAPGISGKLQDALDEASQTAGKPPEPLPAADRIDPQTQEHLSPQIQKAAQLAAKGWGNMTPAERQEFHRLMIPGTAFAQVAVTPSMQTDSLKLSQGEAAIESFGRGVSGSGQLVGINVNAADPQVAQAQEQVAAQGAKENPVTSHVAGFAGAMVDPGMRAGGGMAGKAIGVETKGLLATVRAAAPGTVARAVAANLASSAAENAVFGAGIATVEQIRSGNYDPDAIAAEAAKQGIMGPLFHSTLGVIAERFGQPRADQAAVKAIASNYDVDETAALRIYRGEVQQSKLTGQPLDVGPAAQQQAPEVPPAPPAASTPETRAGGGARVRPDVGTSEAVRAGNNTQDVQTSQPPPTPAAPASTTPPAPELQPVSPQAKSEPAIVPQKEIPREEARPPSPPSPPQVPQERPRPQGEGRPGPRQAGENGPPATPPKPETPPHILSDLERSLREMSYRDVAREAAARKIDTRTLSKAELTEKILQFEGRKPAPKPEPQSPVSRVLMDQGAALARKYGLKFTGVGDGAMRFTDPVSKKPVEIKPGEDVPAKLKSLRVVPGDSATPTGGGSKYGRSEPARPNPTRDEGKIKQEFSRRAVEQKLHEWLTQNDAETGRPDKFTPTTIHGAEGEPPTVIERPVLPKDALDGLPPVEKARLSKFVDEDAWSAITQHMNARQMDALQGEMMSRAGETKGTRLERAMETAKKSGDPRAKFLAAYLENAPPMGEQVPKEWLDAGSLTENDVGKTFEIHGEKFRVDVGDDGNLILKDHITIENPESLGKIPVDKGTVKEPEEAELGDEPFNPDEEKPNPRKDIPGELLLESHNISEYKPDEAVQKRGNKWGYKHISGTNNQSMFRTKAEAVLAAEKHREFMREQLEEKIDALPERKTTGPQGSLLGERYEGSGIGSKTGSMFGDTSRGAASKLEESAPASALEKKFADTKSGELFNPGESLPSERGAGNALNAQGGDKPAESATPSPETGRIGSPEKPKVERDEYQRNEIRNSIAEGELILRTGKFHGKPRTESQLTAVRKSVDNAYEKLGETPPMQVGDKFPFPGSKPKDKFPVVTDVRLTPEGKRQYQVRFGEKTDAQWMPTPRPLADAELGNPPAPKASDVVDPENESGLGEKSIGAAEDAAATARKLAQQSKGKSFLDYAAEGMKKTAGLPMKVLRNFRERLNFLNTEYGKAGTELVKPMSEYLGSRQHADYAGTSETGRVFKGLSDEQKSEFVALGLDGRRRIENMGVAEKFAQAMFPRKKGEVANKLSGGGLHDAVARAIAAALDHGQSYDHATLGAGIAGKLHDINPDLVTRWANMAAERPEFTPEAMAREESRRALELMKFDEDGRNRILGNKSILDAIERWKTGVEPALMELRARNGMPIDKHWNAVPLALNFVQKPSGRAFTPSPGIRERNPFTFNGEGREKQTDPNLFLSKIIAQHLTADREKSLLAAIRNSALVVPEKKVYVAESGANRGREVAIVQGNETPVQKYDVARNAAQPEEIYLPQKLVKELDTLNRVDRPDNSTKIGGWIIGIGLQGKAAFHAMSALMNASATISAKGPGRWENIVPWLGSRAGTAVRGVRDAFSPVGDMHQMLLNDLEASGNRGIGSVHNERTYSQIAGEYMAGREKLGQTAKEVLTKFAGLGHDVLFKPKVGAENIMRAQLLDSFMQVATGEWYTRLKSDVRAGKVSPLRAAEMIRKVLPPADYQKAQRFINDTLGWMDPNARSVSMNRAQKIFPFLGTEASTIPGSIKRLFTANVDFAGIGKALGAKDFKGAGIKAAQGLLGGPVGLFAFANLLNYAINGRLMSDNDADHKHEVHLGGGWYWGLDSQLQRAARLTGMQGIVNKRPAATVKEIAGHWANEGQSILHPAIGSLWDLAMALSGGKSLYSGRSGVFFSPKLNDAWTSLVPYFSNTAASIAAGKGAGEGLAKDVAGTLGQSVRRDDGDLSKVLEHASAEEAVSLYKQASPEQRKVIGSAVRMKIARSNQKSDLYQQIK